MSQIAVDTSRCKKDGACVAVCPSGTLGLDEQGFPAEVHEDRCILCGHCVAVCSCDAITHAGLPEEALLPMPAKLPDPELMDGFLMSRRSVRAFKDKPVSVETLESLLDVARRAPTASNSQKLHWIVVNGAAKVHTLAEETINWIRTSETNPAGVERWDLGYDFVLRGAPAVVVACAPASYDWGKQDCAIALTFLELAAESRGLGVCWAGYLTRIAALHPPLRHALSVPEGYAVCGGLMLGVPRFTYRRIPPRKPLSVQWS
jgi:nitroreductase/NAD-dependent dihydropyrimidine dehydrogenase PreA subunit